VREAVSQGDIVVIIGDEVDSRVAKLSHTLVCPQDPGDSMWCSTGKKS
jgi:hypothetical protein